ncbi:MAG: tRNA lysidine(34) synthetase TilS [Bacteroidales bacterium]|nr:tRNA lysidine(34) synthetase TilS [Bacteroidales bacterium]MDD4217976.1 tRNA lysidine(34) synthetase TilS [Bacteroidales bacterium]
MIKEVYRIIQSAGISKKAKILCAISGGIDSTVMLHVLHELDLHCVVAHCNFHLRGEDANKDEQFVKELAAKFEYKFISQDFDTEAYAQANGISIQMAARDLRYEFFYDAAEKYDCQYIALAHNSDDQVETVLTNLVRGTGIRGLTGMDCVKNKLLRPILDVSREKIEEFANENYIEYCVDITNNQTKYSRNKLRHKVIPLLEEINRAAKENILRSVKYLSDTELIMKEFVDYIFNKSVYYKGQTAVVELSVLEKYSAKETLLYEILLKLDLPKNLAVEAISLIEAQTGKYCEFLNIRILKNRNNLIVDKKYNPKEVLLLIPDVESLSLMQQVNHKASIINYNSNYKINKDANVAGLDLDKIKFPLLIRNWNDGDRFKPFGMNNYKKLSDFFSDLKLSSFEKDKVLVFMSDDDIFWVSSLRIDNRFKITAQTKRVLEIKVIL